MKWKKNLYSLFPTFLPKRQQNKKFLSPTNTAFFRKPPRSWCNELEPPTLAPLPPYFDPPLKVWGENGTLAPYLYFTRVVHCIYKNLKNNLSLTYNTYKILKIWFFFQSRIYGRDISSLVVAKEKNLDFGGPLRMTC